jgi:hypothetical protein
MVHFTVNLLEDCSNLHVYVNKEMHDYASKYSKYENVNSSAVVFMSEFMFSSKAIATRHCQPRIWQASVICPPIMCCVGNSFQGQVEI